MAGKNLPFKQKVEFFKWDRQLDFEKTKDKLVRMLREYRNSSKIRYIKRFVKIAVLLTQLYNGARVSEALEAVKIFAYTRQRKVYVQTRKSKLRRLIIIPAEIHDNDASKIRALIGQIDVQKIKDFARKTLGFNTHALRYSFITYLARKGISAQVIAKITGHKNLNYILWYTQGIEAEKVLEDIVLG